MLAYLSLGTNIEPELNAVKMVERLCENFGNVVIYPFVYTQAVNMDRPSLFLNSMAVIDTQYTQEKLKLVLNKIEGELGRDRNDPLKSVKDRTADIDILMMTETFDEEIFINSGHEDYIISCLQIHDSSHMADLKPYGLPSYQGATTVNWDRHAGKIIIVEDKFQSLING